MHAENYKPSLKDIKENLIKWKDLLYSLTGRPDIVKMAVLLTDLQIQHNAYQNPSWGFFFFLVEINKLILKFI